MVSTRSKTESGSSEKRSHKETSETNGVRDGDHTEKEPNSSTKPEKKRQKTAQEKEDNIGGLTLQYAKSGRADCRKCGETIAKGAPRVGMEAWISGRQAMTWQCVTCFLDNLSVDYTKQSGKRKCSATGDFMDKGEVALAAHSHTSTRYFKLDAIHDVLSVVLTWFPSQKRKETKKLLSLEKIEGHKNLKSGDCNMLETVLSETEFRSPGERGKLVDEEDQAKDNKMKIKAVDGSPDETALNDDGKQKKDEVARQEGTVEWKFRGDTYQGTLLPNQETESECFAKTHQGHVKTLSKATKSWSAVSNWK